MKLLVLQETDWIKRGPHLQHHLMDRMALSPVIRECERMGLEHFILHTRQHYWYNMDRVFFEHLGLPEARYNMEAGDRMMIFLIMTKMDWLNSVKCTVEKILFK